MSEDKEQNSPDAMEDVADDESEDDAEPLAPPISPELWAKLPPDARKEFRNILSASVSYMGPPINPLIAKMNKGHIATLLDQTENARVRDDDYRKSNRWFTLLWGLGIVAVILIVLFFFKDRPDILTHLITAIGGIGVGFGAREFTSRAKGN